MNVDFGAVLIEIPGISHIFGYYKQEKFEFSDKTLEQLLGDLSLWKNDGDSSKNITN